MNASAYWFYICSMYFPFCQNEFLTESKFELIPETFNKILDRIILNKKNLKKKSYINTKNKFLNDIKSFFQDEAVRCVDNVDVIEAIEDGGNSQDIDDKTNSESKALELASNQETQFISSKQESTISIAIDAYIERMETSLSKLNNSNNALFKRLTQELKENVGNLSLILGKEYFYDPDDVLNDLKYTHSNSKDFQRYLINKHEAKNISTNCTESEKKSNSFILSRVEEEELNNNPDDIVCVVCNDGDYEDDDLIVYCSSCQMTVHQSCYGIVVLPKEDWICHPCIACGPEKSKFIQCVCCPVKGGAMKPTMLKKSSSFYLYISNLKQKEEIESPSKFNSIKTNLSKSTTLYSPQNEFEIFKKKSDLISDNIFKENPANEVASISTKDHGEFKLLNKNNNLILNGNSSINLITNYFNGCGSNQNKTEADNSESVSTFLNEIESKKTSISVLNSKQRKRGRQKKSNKSKIKN